MLGSTKLSPDTQALLCSFCRKPQSAVQKLISGPSQAARAYICDECIAVCASIVGDDAPKKDEAGVIEDGHPLLAHAMASSLMTALELWVKRESLGEDGAEALGEVYAIASAMLSET